MARHVSQPPFLVQHGERQQEGIVATIYGNVEPRYRNLAQQRELPAQIKFDNEMNEEKSPWSVSKHSGSTTPGRFIDTLNNESPGVVWDEPTLSFQFNI